MCPIWKKSVAALSFPGEFQQAGASSHGVSARAAILCPSHTDILNGTELMENFSSYHFLSNDTVRKIYKNEIIIIMEDNSVRMGHKTQFIALLPPEGSD